MLGNAKVGDFDYSKAVAFPFGYGLSYAKFSYSDVTFEESEDSVTVSVTVTNDSDKYDGKDVVQIYMQRPYTGRNGVEIPSIELVGFAKTGVLKANGGEETVTVTVDKENMRTYDAYGAGTYILEKGDYYFSFGNNAHDALNNVLMAKAENGVKVNKDRMFSFSSDGKGDADRAYKVSVEKVDTEIYSVSEETNNKIENQFNDADLNLYEGTKNDQRVTYLSRSDWEGTFPTEAVQLECTNEIMVADMQYGHEVEVAEGDEMPVYETVTAPEGELTLAMMMDLEFDDPKWQDLLNQMSLTEQQWLCSYGLLKMAGAPSVAAPGAKATDGPGGVKNNNPVAGQQFGFPSPVVMAQTWNTELIEELGVAFAHEALHLNIAVVYAPGANIHRSLYSGRNWEYYSEDGFLSGKILSSEVKGLQSKGIMVMTKHFAFNDQERNRYGVATFFNEQSAREIYLRAFEIAVRESDMNGVMSSFNRVGCTWAGAHKGLLTNILRGEWNFLGIVETDSCTGNTFHMGSTYAKAEGLVAGNDMWMANGSETYFEESKDNATVMLALREACHRILYNQLHSLAMNGVSTNTRIIQVAPWWETALVGVDIAFGVLALACIVMAVLSFVFASRKYKAWQAAKAERTAAKGQNVVRSSAGGGSDKSSSGAGGGGGKRGGKVSRFVGGHKKILLIVLGIVLAVAIVLAIVLPIALAGKKDDGNLNGDQGGIEQPGDTENPGDGDNPGDVTPPEDDKHECEQVCPVCGGCLDTDCTEEECATKCGEGKTAYSFEAEDAEIKDGTASYKGYTIQNNGNRTFIGDLNQNTGATVTFTVEAEEATTASLVITITRRTVETVFTDKFGVSVNNGRDIERPTIIPAYQDQWADSSFMQFNLGCIELQKGENTIRFTVLTTGDMSGYNFDKITLLSDVAVSEPHTCTQVCTICGGCLDDECQSPVCATKCPGHEWDNLEILGMQSELGDGKNGSPIQAPNEGAPVGLVGELSRNEGASLTFRFKPATGGKATLIAHVTQRTTELNFSDFMTVTVDGQTFETAAKVPAPSDGRDHWLEPVPVTLGEITLTAGKTTEITFTVCTSNDMISFNFYSMEVDMAGGQGQPDPEPSVAVTGVLLNNAPATLKAGESVTLEYTVSPENATNKGVTWRSSDDQVVSVSDAGVVTAIKEGVATIIVTTEDGGKTDECVIEVLAASEPDPEPEPDPAEYTVELDGVTQAARGSGINGLPNKSGNVVGALSENKGASLTFKFTAEQAGEAQLIAATTRRDTQNKFTDVFNVYVNGTEYASDAVIPTEGKNDWSTLTEISLGTIGLVQGINTVKIEVASTNVAICVNFGYISITSEVRISEHVCSSVCADCNKCMDADCQEFGCAEKCEDYSSVTLDGNQAEFGEGSSGMPNFETQRDGLVGNLSTNEGAKLTFKVNSEQGKTARLYVAVTTRMQDLKFTDTMSVTVNGVALESQAIVPKTDVGEGRLVDNWYDWVVIDLGEITLNEGENTIVFTRLNSNDTGFNFHHIQIVADAA